MILYFRTKPNNNGASYQLKINFDKKQFAKGYFVFNPCFNLSVLTDKKSISELVKDLKRNNFSEIDN